MTTSAALSTGKKSTRPVSSLPATGKTFRLTGPSFKIDPRIHAVRHDIADVDLADRVFAPHYAQAECYSVSTPSTMVRVAAKDDAEASSQLLFGERFAVLDIMGGWAWGYCLQDGYVGFVKADTLSVSQEAPTHIVNVQSALIFTGPSIKQPSCGTLTLGSRIAGEEDGNFLKTALGYIHMRHLAPIESNAFSDPVETAKLLLGQPYLWAGRGANGVDCSGLVQLALSLGGIPCPRDCDQQASAVGEEIAEGAGLQRGDLVYFPGHVGIMIDGDQILHANAFWMKVVIEPLADVVERLKPTIETPITGRRRLI